MYRNKRLILAAVIILVVIPVIIGCGVYLGDRNYAITSTAIVILSMLPFFLIFESRKPKVRELIPIAVMTALAAASRVAFSFLPQFKPILALVMITGISFGAEAGFLCGSVSMLSSNFFFGQGPWTPWQMFCCGIIGFLAGLLAKRMKLGENRVSVCIFGVLAGYLYGAIVDIWSIVGFTQDITWQTITAIYASGFWFNTIFAVGTAVFLFLLAKPMVRILHRIKIKYGLIEEEE